jgi:hypothetical protein
LTQHGRVRTAQTLDSGIVNNLLENLSESAREVLRQEINIPEQAKGKVGPYFAQWLK